jgi:Xaa-Pro aminopeptidase
MQSDLDRLMRQRGYAAILVTGRTLDNPPMYYLTGGAKIGESTILVKRPGRPAVLYANPMEREEAAKSGLRVKDVASQNLGRLIKEEKGDRLRASARMLGNILAECGVSGQVAVFGRRDQGEAFQLISAVNKVNRHVELVGEWDDSLFGHAMMTKSGDEAARIRAVGRKTVAVVAATADFLTSHRASRGFLVKRDGSRLLIGDVKAFIRRQMMEQGIVDPEDATIFAIGRDAGIPHSRGAARQPVALGKSIVFDIFPAEPGGGYYYDMTRTWCLGYAPEAVEKIYEEVAGAYHATLKALKVGGPAGTYQRLVCDHFERLGHPTIRTQPTTTSGYVHSVGHGVGLRIHETPRLSDFTGNPDRLEPGVVFTVEPGLYYPERGYGARLEDTVWLNPKTLRFEVLARYSHDLVLPVRPARR